jgi:hypothetical protein
MLRFFKIILMLCCIGFTDAVFPEAMPMTRNDCLIVTSNNFNSMKGTQGQNTFCNYRGKIVMKNKVNGIANPCSPKQQLIRDAVATIINFWTGDPSMTEQIKALWDLRGAQIPTQPNPETGVRAIIRRSNSIQTGLDCFIAYNIRALTAGAASLPQVLTPPAHIGSAKPVSNISCSWLPSGTLTVTWTKDPSTIGNDKARLWIVSRTAGAVHKQLLGVAGAAAETIAVTQFSGKNGVITDFANILGTDLYLQMDVVRNDTGDFSAPSNTIVSQVA